MLQIVHIRSSGDCLQDVNMVQEDIRTEYQLLCGNRGPVSVSHMSLQVKPTHSWGTGPAMVAHDRYKAYTVVPAGMRPATLISVISELSSGELVSASYTK